MSFIQAIRNTSVGNGSLAIFYLAQAGFYFKTVAGTRLLLDPYLTDACNPRFGFKRMIPTVLTPEEAEADLLVATHSHDDHLDPEALPILARQAHLHFIGSADCEAGFAQCRIPPARFDLLRPGDQVKKRDVTVRAIDADHAELCPTAIGVIIESEGIVVYNTGDTAYVPDRILRSLAGVTVDVMIAPINGQFGNMNARQACQLALVVKPRVLIASHFWMFVEHAGVGGDPATFMEEASKLPKGIKGLVMAPGEKMMVTKTGGEFRVLLSPGKARP